MGKQMRGKKQRPIGRVLLRSGVDITHVLFSERHSNRCAKGFVGYTATIYSPHTRAHTFDSPSNSGLGGSGHHLEYLLEKSYFETANGKTCATWVCLFLRAPRLGWLQRETDKETSIYWRSLNKRHVHMAACEV